MLQLPLARAAVDAVVQVIGQHKILDEIGRLHHPPQRALGALYFVDGGADDGSAWMLGSQHLKGQHVHGVILLN